MVTQQKSRPPSNSKRPQGGRPLKDIVIAAAAVAAVLIAVSVVIHVVRSNQPNIIYSPITGASPKAQWIKEHQSGKSTP